MNKIFKKLITERLIIKPLTVQDAAVYHAAEILSSDEMASYWSWVDKNKSLSAIKDFLQDAENTHAQDKPSMMFFGVFTKHSNIFCGCIWYAGINWFVPKFEIAYWQVSNQCRNGYMTEALHALTWASLEFYHAKRVDIKIFINNKKSRNLAERVGFKLEAILKNYFIDFVTKEIVDAAVYVYCDIQQLQKLNLKLEI